MANIFKQMQSRQIQKKANNFIKSLEGKSDRYIEHAYLDNKELRNNEIVLSYIFFKHPDLIKILPIKFQIERINSNLSMFKYASIDVKKKIVSGWLKGNKFFMNANVVQFDPEEMASFLKLYFKQPEDIAKLFMDDLRRVIKTLADSDIKETEKVIDQIKDKLDDRQWEYILEVNPIFIKYASQAIQNKYADDERFNKYINGEARNVFVDRQIEKIKEDLSVLYTMNIDVQKEFVHKYPFMINYLDEKTMIEVLKYDIELIKYVNMPALKNNTDKTQEVIYGVLDNVENKSMKEVVDIFINKCVLTAKGKLYRYDSSSNDMSYQYTKRAIKMIQSLSLNQISALVNIDANYALPYIIPIYNEDTEKDLKESETMAANARCLKLFEFYYGEKIYEQYYKVINKIYVEYMNNLDKYDYTKDYNCIFELFKVLFNKQIIAKNNPQKITVFLGMSMLYKTGNSNETRPATVKLLNEIINTAYDVEINNDKDIYDINTLEIYDKRFGFINPKLLHEFDRFNFVNMSSLLLLIKSNTARKFFEIYYGIVSKIYTENKETLYRCIENFGNYYEILANVEGQRLSTEEKKNLLILLSSFANPVNITNRSQLLSYDLLVIKKFVENLSAVKDINVYKNVLANFLFNKGYDLNGNFGWLDVSTIKEIMDIYDVASLEDANAGGKKIFNEEELALFAMIKLLFNTDDLSIILQYIENIVTIKNTRNTIPIIDLFNKIKKYRLEIINAQIVTIRDIEVLGIDRPEIVKKSVQEGVTIYRIIKQDFRVLCSESDDGIEFCCESVLKLEKNCYGYNQLIKNGSLRFTTDDGKTIIKINKDNKEQVSNKPNFLIVIKDLNDSLIDIAKEKGLVIVQIDNGMEDTGFYE